MVWLLGTIAVIEALGLIFLAWYLTNTKVPRKGSTVEFSLATEMVEKIATGLAAGIRASLGYGEIVAPEPEEPEGPIAVIRDLEYDPFMMNGDGEWLVDPPAELLGLQTSSGDKAMRSEVSLPPHEQSDS